MFASHGCLSLLRINAIYVSLSLSPTRPTAWCSVTLRVVTLPGTYFDGTANVTFKANGDGDGGNDDSILVAPATAATDEAQGGGTSSSLEEEGSHSALLQEASDTGGTSNTASFTATFFHCKAGSFWNRTDSGQTGLDGYTGECEPCTEDGMDGGIEVWTPKRDGIRGG